MGELFKKPDFTSVSSELDFVLNISLYMIFLLKIDNCFR